MISRRVAQGPVAKPPARAKVEFNKPNDRSNVTWHPQLGLRSAKANPSDPWRFQSFTPFSHFSWHPSRSRLVTPGEIALRNVSAQRGALTFSSEGRCRSVGPPKHAAFAFEYVAIVANHDMQSVLRIGLNETFLDYDWTYSVALEWLYMEERKRSSGAW